ncbi:succinate--CoA ligase subunit alpha [Candidatus Woesearchaeota archaeon]|nr:succinate--CoA ligase subunit alpha [Candidatus Woesearchaeota archaeon]
MAVLVGKNTKVIVQGITGQQGSFHTKLMLEYGTQIVAGVTPGKAGQSVEGVPVFGTVKDALAMHPADFSIIFVPAKFLKDAAFESLSNGLDTVLITENVPLHDVLSIIEFARGKKRLVIGPNCPGIITPGETKLGIMPGHIFSKGNTGVISRSGTLTYEIIEQMTRKGIGQSTVIGIGGDQIVGTNFIDALAYFGKDDETREIVLIGEIGGDQEERAAEFIQNHVSKKVVAYIAGVHAPKGKRMGHAGAIITGNAGTAESKINAFERIGVKVARLPSEIIGLLG